MSEYKATHQEHDCGCTEAMNSIFLYMDNEIDDLEKAHSIEIHLSGCQPCNESLKSEQRVRDMVARCCGCDETPDPVREKLLERLTELRFQLNLGEAQ